MDRWMLIFCVMPAFVTSVTVLSNGNSPETKTRHMLLESNKFNPITPRPEDVVKYKTNKVIKINSTKIGINERYRRLIPYMTFYYANDIATPSTVPQQDQGKSVEVDKAEIIETGNINPNQREERVINSFLRHKNIPRYQGNRLTQHNIASANPGKFYLKEVPTFYQPPNKYTPNYNPLLVNHDVYEDREREYEKFIAKPIKAPSSPFTQQTRKPFLNFYQNDDANVQYYLSEKEVAPKYKLIPYEQTPPIKTFTQYENVEPVKHYNVPINAPNEPIYIKPRPKPTPPQFIYVHENEQYRPKRPPTTISEMYYEKQTPVAPLAEPIIESGFQPILASRPLSTERPQYTSVYHQQPPKLERPPEDVVIRKPSYQYILEESSYISKPTHNENTKTASLADLLNSLQINKSIPKPITKDNVSASITTLLQVLNALRAQQNEIEPPVLSTPRAFEAPELVHTTPSPVSQAAVEQPPQGVDFEEPYLAQVNSPSQHLDEYPSGGSSQRYPQPIHSDEEGGTPGRPGVDYPILTVIPPTKFDCKTQRYKGFFADPETRCQVWHYCDLNGGQASFLCPNGTIFSQAGLTCDWWFNVRCASTPQLYVLNESLYKFIIPHSPKFPEDYSGPLVDKYLTLKFKEMEEQFKKNKNKNAASEKIDSEDEPDTMVQEETSTENKSEIEGRAIEDGGVIIQSAGSSGNVERLQEK
ncbi:uncharacterized protein LOC123708823 isoform X1 [Pieris brassicae]|uniref:uncharacterized protein LOC123708823 isoform X1 n=1 Tax=Pieris brassicae TaxID=7116 RepID=UPI001E661C71|nr:uncharacterized protein LOC123708823 isoform X1 [Pieris brassicae]